MIVKELAHGAKAKERLIESVNMIVDCISSTLGARGRLVMIENDGRLIDSTKDGYRVLNSLFFEGSYDSMVGELLKEAVRKTMEEAGDNTTTTAVFAQALINEAYKLIQSGKSPIDVKNDIEKSKEIVVRELDKLSTPLTDKLIYDVAMTSSNGDSALAEIVSKAFIEAGENGNVTFTRSVTDESVLERVDGTLIESGFAHELFVNVHSEQSVFYENPLIVVSEINFNTNQKLVPFLEAAVTQNRPIVFITEMEFHVRDMILKNVLEKKIQALVIPPPSFGGKRREIMEDIALICNTQTISTLSGELFVNRVHEFLGEAKSITTNKQDSVLVPHDNSPKEKIQGKIADLKSQSKNSKFNLQKQYLNDRVSKLSGGVSIIKVGAVVESELNEKMDRVEDAVLAVRAAKEQGVVCGGGLAMFHINSITGLDLTTSKALDAPMIKIIENAHVDVSKLEGFSYPVGYDVRDYKMKDLMEAGIIDTVKGLKQAYLNAVSVSNTILMTDYIINQKRA